MPEILEKSAKETGYEVEDLYAAQVREMLSRQNGLPKEYFSFCFQPARTLEYFLEAIIGSGDEILTVGPTDESIFEIITRNDALYSEFYEKPAFIPDPSGAAGIINRRTRFVLLGNPNKFTGTIYTEKEIEHILQFSDRSILLLDETTFDFAGISAIGLIRKYDNLALLRSFTTNSNMLGNYIISNPAVFQGKYSFLTDKMELSQELPEVLENLRKSEFIQDQIKRKKEEMLFLSTRLRLFSLECRLTPDYSIIIRSPEPERLVFVLSKTGSQFLNLECFPGMRGFIRLQLSPAIDVLSIIDAFEKEFYKEHTDKTRCRRLTIRRQSEAGEILESDNNIDIIPEKAGE